MKALLWVSSILWVILLIENYVLFQRWNECEWYFLIFRSEWTLLLITVLFLWIVIWFSAGAFIYNKKENEDDSY